MAFGNTDTKTPILLCDFFRSQHRERKPSKEASEDSYIRNLLKNRATPHKVKVFLCGHQLGDQPHQAHFDKRIQIKKLLISKMGCDAFLGEDIEDIKKPPTVDADALTIEVQEARTSDLIFLFLESFGTTSELTAFVLTKSIIDKLVVFNDIKHKNAATPSFLTLGPLKLLQSRKNSGVLYYDPSQIAKGISNELVEQIDVAVAKIWFAKCQKQSQFKRNWTFELFAVFSLIYAHYPIEKVELEQLCKTRFTDSELKSALKKLRAEKLISERRKSFYEPAKKLEEIGLDKDFQADFAKCRSKLLHERLNSVDVESNYRLIL